MRILVVFGTRPEIIKLGPVCRALRQLDGVVMGEAEDKDLVDRLLDEVCGAVARAA
jgi:UDP-N-acetylglucosamine 2-epimerase